jgi:hypothetical protein
MREKEIYQALVDISEVLYDLVSLPSNYSTTTGKKLSQALRSINKCIPEKKENN